MAMIDPTALFSASETLTALALNQQRAKITTVGLGLWEEGYVELEFQFNPKDLKITKELSWKGEKSLVPERNAPALKFGGGKPAKFDLTLVFDTSQNVTYRDVRMYTN